MDSDPVTEPTRMSPAVPAGHPRTSGSWRWWSVLVLVVGLAAIFAFVAATGARDVARGQRALGFLEPVIHALSGSGWDLVHWLLAHSRAVGWYVTALAAAVALAGVVIAQRCAVSLLLLTTAVSCAVWGQTLLLADQTVMGAWLYGSGIVCSVALGVLYPIWRFQGFQYLLPPSGPGLPVSRSGASVATHWGWECLLVLLLSLAAMLTRTYALNELPHFLDLEESQFWILSRTLHGLHFYLTSQHGLTTSNAGFVHLLANPALFTLFGTSLYSNRLAAVLFGLATVPLLYWLVRRMAGVGAAAVATVLLITAPEQLFWSRNDDSHFTAVAVLGVLTAHAALWMVQRGSIWSVLTASLWMPASRFFYAAGWDMVAYPVIAYGHATVFVRSAWRKAWWVVPLLAAGLAAWVVSVSVVDWLAGNGSWRFVHPAFTYGAPAWRMQGAHDFRDAGWLELLQLQARTMVERLEEVVAGICYHGPRMFSQQWFSRAIMLPNHATVMNAGGAVLCALGLGYLLGQLADPRAFALLVWVALGVAPALMSLEPSPRRFVVMFPAVCALSGTFVAAAVRLLRDCCGRAFALVAAALVGVAVTGIAWTSLASHFQLPIEPLGEAPAVGFSRPLFKENDLILHQVSRGLGGGIANVILFGNLDEFLTGHTCYQSVEGRAWGTAALHAAVELPCEFDSPQYEWTMSRERRETLRRQYAPRHVAFLLEETPAIRPLIDMVLKLYPQATVSRASFNGGARRLMSLRVNAEDARALQMPSISVPAGAAGAADLQDGLLSGVRLARVYPENTSDEPEIVVRGGMLLPSDGWYGFALAPACDDAVLRLHERPVSRGFAPLLEGVYSFEIRLPPRHACQLPLHIEMQSEREPRATPMPATQFVSPAVASIGAAYTPPVREYSGYGEAQVLTKLSGSSIDMGIDGNHDLTVLSSEPEGDRRRVQRFDQAGNEAARWYPEFPAGAYVHGMAVDTDGTSIVSAGAWVLQYDRAGNQLAAWMVPWGIPQDIALAPDGSILLAVPDRDAIAVFERDGKLRGELKTFQGGTGRLSRPAAITVGPHGKAIVIQEDGQALLFQMARNPLQPKHVGTFRVAFTSAPRPILAQGSAFDGPERLLMRLAPAPLVYSAAGERLLAATPARDLGRKGLGEIRRFVVSEDSVYALARDQIWRIAR